MTNLKGLRPTHPGELLREDVFPSLGKSKAKIAEMLGISRQTLYDILGERSPITPIKKTFVSFSNPRPSIPRSPSSDSVPAQPMPSIVPICSPWKTCLPFRCGSCCGSARGAGRRAGSNRHPPR